jgi:hypothetical protein
MKIFTYTTNRTSLQKKKNKREGHLDNFEHTQLRPEQGPHELLLLLPLLL